MNFLGVWAFSFQIFFGITSKFDYFYGVLLYELLVFIANSRIFLGVLQIPSDQIFLGYGAAAGSEPMYEQKFGVSPLDKLFLMKVDFKSLILPRRKSLKWQHTRLGFVASIHEEGHCDGFISEFAQYGPSPSFPSSNIFTASKGSNLYLFNSISSHALLEIMFESFRDLHWSSLQSQLCEISSTMINSKNAMVTN